MKPAIEWLNAVGEAVMVSAFAGSNPPGIETERVIKRIQDDARADACVEVARLTWALNKVIAVASGEEQVAIDDTEGMAWIVEYANGVLAQANAPDQRPERENL